MKRKLTTEYYKRGKLAGKGHSALPSTAKIAALKWLVNGRADTAMILNRHGITICTAVVKPNKDFLFYH